MKGNWLGFLSVLGLQLACLLATCPAYYGLGLFQPAELED